MSEMSVGNCRESRVRGRGLEVEGQKSRVASRGSQVEGRKSRVIGRGWESRGRQSKVKGQNLSVYVMERYPVQTYKSACLI